MVGGKGDGDCDSDCDGNGDGDSGGGNNADDGDDNNALATCDFTRLKNPGVSLLTIPKHQASGVLRQHAQKFEI